MPDEFKKPYNPKASEDNIYKVWEESDYFNPDTCVKNGVTRPDAEPYSIVLPPPNVTGTLHMGHAAMLAIEDIMVRFERMRGKRTLWIPGTDHAAIATQAKVESDIYKKEKKTRHDFSREEFLKRVEKFAQESHDTIVRQLKKMGASLDWSREAYTLDEKRNLAVRTAFKRMYDGGLIYRGERIVNWDPKLQTTVSDDEIDWVEETAPFYYLKYGPFVIGTARPETKFGDKYVVMHPDDERYKKYKDGDKLELEWIEGPITATVVKDEAIDMEFGTGVMTITPWHDAADFDIADRHNLEKEQIIDETGKLLAIAGEFAGMHIQKARPLIVEKLKSKGLIEKTDEKYAHRLPVNSRGEGVIEPQIKLQWFVDVNKKTKTGKSLKEMMREAVESGAIKIIPERFEKFYFHWIDNLRDWCISRQIWYGHQIPVWYKDAEIYCGVNPPKESGWQQDHDTLDTWFSSGLWTFSTLGWPEETEDLKTYHPTSVLETGYDILFFWIARMIMMSTFLLGEIPFKVAYLHGLVRDEKGQKMSKSLGNIIDPLDMIEKYGADATRLSLIIGTGPGNDSKLSEDKVRGYKNFTNKIWNASRFVLENIEGFDFSAKPDLSETEQAYLKELGDLTKEITADIENYRFYLAGEKLYHYFWHRFADIIIEDEKKRIKEGGEAEKAGARFVLREILLTSLKLLHPFMPFVSEKIWSAFPENKNRLLMVESWPK
ncbi:MAG: valine--tRNA ligase [Candidatus Niyogibacteria bacterium]|nr:valine--tRNA ligase [Candidatus Niyogibacteria bacterium]